MAFPIAFDAARVPEGELPFFSNQVGSKLFQNISEGLYRPIVYIWFISYKMHLVFAKYV